MALGRQHETTEQSVRRCHDVHLTTRVERYAWQSTRNHLDGVVHLLQGLPLIAR